MLIHSLTHSAFEIKSTNLHVFRELLERLAALCALFFLCPVLLAVAILVMVDSKGSPFFIQKRHGYRGRIFNIYKFRTMYTAYCHHNSVVSVTCEKQDMRITRIGRFLRRTSLDELPQLWNVVKGDMALVGPRPLAVEHNQEQGRKVPNYWLRHTVKPGLTGIVQISKARHADLSDPKAVYKRLMLDLYYIRNRSLMLDIKIMLSTVRVMMSFG